jgi:hypothetical protein
MKPENQFIQSIHRKLRNTYFEKNNNPYRSGTADVWYSGNRGDLWVEYKYIERIPRSSAILPDLTPRQRRWLNNRHDEGRNIAVILGTPDGGVIYRNKDWIKPLSDEQMIQNLVTRTEISRWIYEQVGAGCASTQGAFEDIPRRRRGVQNPGYRYPGLLSDKRDNSEGTS